MSDEYLQEDQSHYEISLTGAQAFVAFVLLLLSLAASFAFGLMIGKGQADGRLVVQREPTVVTEASLASRPADGRIVELGVGDTASETKEAAPGAADSAPAPVVIEEPPTTEVSTSDFAAAPAETPAAAAPAATVPAPAATRPAEPRPAAAKAPSVPHYAQLLSTGDQKTAETLAAQLIDNGFNSAYVERGTNEKGQIFRVRVKFGSEAEARAAEARLRTFSKEVWITK